MSESTTPTAAVPELPTQVEVVTPPEPAAEPQSNSDVNWDEVESGLDEVETVEGDLEVVPPAASAPPVEPTPVAPVASSTPVVPAAVVAPVVPSYEAPTTQAPRQPSPEERAAQEQQHLQALEQLYALSEDDAHAMITEPEKVLPKLLAKMHLQATQSVLNSMQTVVPQIVSTTSNAAKAETEARQAFFSVNDDLAKPEYEPAVLQIAAMYRQINPTAPRAEAIQKIGELARVSLGLPAKGAAQAVAPVAGVPQQPFTPARGGTGGGAPASQNEWAKLASEFDQEI